MAALIFVFIKSSNDIRLSYWKILMSVIFISSISFVTGFTYFDEFTTEETGNYSYEGKHLTSTPLKNYIPIGAQKKIIVFCFSYGCQYCINSIGNLILFKNYVDTIYALAQEDSLKKELFLKYIKPNFVILDLPFEVMKKIIPSYPTTFFIRNDTIVYQYSGFFTFSNTF